MSDILLKVTKPRGCQSLVVWDRGSHLHLSLLVVKKERRRQGIGTAAVNRVKSVAVELCKPVRLTVDPPRRTSLTRFYAKLGFRQTGRLDMAWDGGMGK